MSDLRQRCIYLARVRFVLGLSLFVLPGFLSRVWVGRGGTTPAAGASIALGEREHGADWLSMLAVVDAGDAVNGVISRHLPKRLKLISLVAAASATGHMLLARQIADTTGARNAASAPMPTDG
jgi:hypothetical protein